MNDHSLNKFVSFSIDEVPLANKLEDDYLEDFPLDFHSFLEQSINDPVGNFEFSNKSIKKAGRSLRKKEGDLKKATDLIQIFRAAHEKPLNTIAYLIGRCCREANIEVKLVKRLKRLETIVDKLQRKTLNGTQVNQTCVSNMNDIGGCRAIFSDLESLNIVKDKLTEITSTENRVHIKDIDDYIISPKNNDCGYRSLHLIYQYEYNIGQNKKFNIEVQLRTRLQHLWATTVEIVDIIEQTKIKTQSHNIDTEKKKKQILWEELLLIMSDYIANIEGSIDLPKEKKLSQLSRLKVLNLELCAIKRLQSFKMVSESIKTNNNIQNGHMMLVIDENTLTVIIEKSFNDYPEAIAVFNNMEKIAANIDGINVLLVSAENLDQLADTYPNYIGDCGSFIEIFLEALDG